MVVDLCPDCHNRPPNGVHFNKERMEELHRIGQQTWENIQTAKGITHDEARKAFMQRYGKNYL